MASAALLQWILTEKDSSRWPPSAQREFSQIVNEAYQDGFASVKAKPCEGKQYSGVGCQCQGCCGARASAKMAAELTGQPFVDPTLYYQSGEVQLNRRPPPTLFDFPAVRRTLQTGTAAPALPAPLKVPQPQELPNPDKRWALLDIDPKTESEE